MFHTIEFYALCAFYSLLLIASGVFILPGALRERREKRECLATGRLRAEQEARLTPEQRRARDEAWNRRLEEWDREIPPKGWRKESFPGVYTKPMQPEWKPASPKYIN